MQSTSDKFECWSMRNRQGSSGNCNYEFLNIICYKRVFSLENHFVTALHLQPARNMSCTSCTVSFASVIHCSMYVASSRSIAIPMHVCSFYSGWISIEWRFLAACRMRHFLHALKTSPVFMKEFAPVDCRYTENSPSIRSLWISRKRTYWKSAFLYRYEQAAIIPCIVCTRAFLVSWVRHRIRLCPCLDEAWLKIARKFCRVVDWGFWKAHTVWEEQSLEYFLSLSYTTPWHPQMMLLFYHQD